MQFLYTNEKTNSFIEFRVEDITIKKPLKEAHREVIQIIKNFSNLNNPTQLPTELFVQLQEDDFTLFMLAGVSKEYEQELEKCIFIELTHELRAFYKREIQESYNVEYIGKDKKIVSFYDEGSFTTEIV
ncbi:hypothetical protein [Sulfurimonas hydrogeniphila]|uniref:hypothetical protein n=1 Tax=Sulfurimonas hydrogeniphila TaxID=2509341 RepID=UPI00125FDB4F|nr:hypothetical protein [Sulfurimonas hydrogeniphila]